MYTLCGKNKNHNSGISLKNCFFLMEHLQIIYLNILYTLRPLVYQFLFCLSGGHLVVFLVGEFSNISGQMYSARREEAERYSTWCQRKAAINHCLVEVIHFLPPLTSALAREVRWMPSVWADFACLTKETQNFGGQRFLQLSWPCTRSLPSSSSWWPAA